MHSCPLNLQALQVRLVRSDEEQRYQALIQAHHYLGSLAKIGETLWYVATYVGEWVGGVVELFLGGAKVRRAGLLDWLEFQAPLFSP